MIFFSRLKSKIGAYLQPSKPASSYIPSININAVEAIGAGATGYLLAGLSQRLRQNSAPTNQEVLLTFGAIGLYVGFKGTVKFGQTLRSMVTPSRPAAPASTKKSGTEEATEPKNKKQVKPVASTQQGVVVTSEDSQTQKEGDNKKSSHKDSEKAVHNEKKKPQQKGRKGDATGTQAPLKSKGTKEAQKARRKRKSI